MLFCGLSKVFSTQNNRQYDSIGAFWDILAERYGRENLWGLGYNWTEDSITYVIGLKQAFLRDEAAYPGASYCEVELPEKGWLRYTGRTEELSKLYGEIYTEGRLQYEIEQFSDDGSCEIWLIRA